MGIDVSKVYMPEPVQDATTGAIQAAPVGTALPTSAREKLSTPWVDAIGYVGSDGVTISGIVAAGDILRDWGLSPIRVGKGEAEPTVQIPAIQVDETLLQLIVGKDNVAKVAATTNAGEQLTAGFNGEPGPSNAMCLSMKDENRRVRIFLPNAQVTELDDINPLPSDGMAFNATFSLNADESGKFIYFIFDNGKVESA
jgi:hypothetical protein